MNRFPFLLARWEARHSFSRVGVYMLSISLGVAALVAVRSFRADVSRSIRAEAQVLLGADVRLSARRAFPDSVNTVVDSLTTAGVPSARAVTAASMVLAPATGNVRLLQIRAVDRVWPFYGQVTTRPEDLWRRVDGPRALVDPAVLTQLQVDVGDSLRVGERTVTIAGVVEDLPTDLGFQTAVGPRVYLSWEVLEETEILAFGSLARHEVFLSLPDGGDRALLETERDDLFQATGVGFTTAEEQADDLTDAVGFLGRYLGLVGLGALLLGGIGVGSAIHVFAKERLTEVAVLRCLGARQGGVFLAYLLQAGGLGLLGSLLGGAVGVAIQQFLPGLLEGLLPVEVDPQVSWGTLAGGVVMGVWVALAFALLPLLTIRDAPPLRALRHSLEASREGRDLLRWGAIGALGATVLILAVLEAPSPTEGLTFAGALALTTALLWAVGRTLIRLARRLVPVTAPYAVRQGISNLFRPQNQTVSVTLALGFGTFVVATVLLVRSNLVRELELQAVEGQPNLLLFDIQTDQRDGVVELLPPSARSQAQVTSLVPSRLIALRGLDREELQRLPYEEQPARWAMRRDYRHTFRENLTPTETLVDGAWWDDAPPVEEGVARISMDQGLADELGVGVGDRVTWEVSGIPVESEITSLREVDWGQFQTNFFVVFEPGALDQAPATYVVLARLEGAEGRAAFQRSLVERYPNVSVLDVSRIQEVVDAILSRVGQAIGFLALFAAFAGFLVLAGALASSRHQRLLEGALLRTLGARRGQIWAVLLVEYLTLGALATLAGLSLAVAGSGTLVTLGFQIDFQMPAGVLFGLWGGVTALTLVTGLVGSRQLLRRAPLPVLRGE